MNRRIFAGSIGSNTLETEAVQLLDIFRGEIVAIICLTQQYLSETCRLPRYAEFHRYNGHQLPE